MKTIVSPYKGLPPTAWLGKTRQLIAEHPLEPDEIVEVVNESWNAIFSSSIGTKPFRIGVDLFPKPQIMGFFLHELIPLEFQRRYPTLWRAENCASDKDLVYVMNEKMSVEIKTSSHPTKIFGNRSYAQETRTSRGEKKSRSGFYIAVNFGKFTKGGKQPSILRVRFGWLDAADWRGQAAATGQQASLGSGVEKAKLVQLFPKENAI